MLARAEERFGPRDRACVVVGIAFGGDHPQVSYPQRPAKYARIRLSEGALREALCGDLHYAFWQLAHECVHLLSPTPGQRVSVLEEGLACWFQRDYMGGYLEYDVPPQWMPSFIRAEALAQRLLALDAGVILAVRRAEPIIGRVDADTLVSFCPALPLDEARALADRFWRDER